MPSAAVTYAKRTYREAEQSHSSVQSVVDANCQTIAPGKLELTIRAKGTG
jgi:hypothetical protein